MVNNRIHKLTERKFSTLKDELLSDTELHYSEINGKEIQSWEQYRDAISEVFRFPDKWVVNMAGHDDWMRDLDWLEKEKYVLAIQDYDDFLQSDLAMREIIMHKYRDLILPYWEKEVEHCMVGGYPKSFQVYLIVNDD